MLSLSTCSSPFNCFSVHSPVSSSFFTNYLTNLLDTLSSKNKIVVLLGDFNADPLKYDPNSNISDFFNLMYSSLLLPHIFSPTCTTTSSATLTDNIFTNNCNSSFVSGNLVNSLSDHHAQFLIMENQHSPLEFDSTELILSRN